MRELKIVGYPDRKFGVSDVCQAFNSEAIGTQVIYHGIFLDGLSIAIRNFDWSKCRVPGQAFIDLRAYGLFDSVWAGDAQLPEKLTDANPFTVRIWRGQPTIFVRRSTPGVRRHPSFLAAVVYTIDAYMLDPDVQSNVEYMQFLAAAKIDQQVKHIIVAVIGSIGPESPLTPSAFIHNLAGGNREALAWTGDEIRTRAIEIKNHWSKYIGVTD